MKDKIKLLLQLDNIVPALVIIIGFLGVAGLLPIGFEKTVIIILSFLAIDAIFERTSFFNKLKKEVSKLGAKRGLRSRLEPDFENFQSYCAGAQDIFVCGLSLGYITVYQRFFFEERLRYGCNFRLLMVDPDISTEAFDLIAEHDERNNGAEFLKIFRNELQTSLTILCDLCKTPERRGHLEVRASKGLPVFTITMVNPTQENGKMRIELRPYKRNLGVRPYLELKKEDAQDNYWYDFFLQRYYVQLWDDSRTITQTSK